jgi:hypothetical protein
MYTMQTIQFSYTLLIFGNKRIVGKIKTNDETKKDFDEAIASGRNAGLLSKSKNNIFNCDLGTIEAKQVCEVQLRVITPMFKGTEGNLFFEIPRRRSEALSLQSIQDKFSDLELSRMYILQLV